MTVPTSECVIMKMGYEVEPLNGKCS